LKETLAMVLPLPPKLGFCLLVLVICVVTFLNTTDGFSILPPLPYPISPISPISPVKKSSFNPTTSVEPILIIPGLLASSLEAKLQGNKPPHFYCKTNSDWFLIWVDQNQLIPGVVDCLVHNLELHYDPVNNKVTNTSGVSIRSKNFGSLSGAPYMTNFTQFLIANGYQLDLSLRIATYDWRLDSNGFINDGEFQKVANLIEDMYYANNNSRVHLVGHSYGGSFAYWFVSRFAQQEWKDKYIASIISLGAPWLGTVMTSAVLLDMVELFAGQNGPYKQLEYLFRTFPSSVSMLPSEVYEKEIVISTPSKNYTADMNNQLFIDSGANLTAEIRKNNADDYNDLSHPGTNVYCVFGVDLPTPITFHFGTDQFRNLTGVSTGDGDGSIALNSLKFCEQWIDQDSNYRVEAKAIPKAEHATMIMDPDVLNYILSVTTSRSKSEPFSSRSK